MGRIGMKDTLFINATVYHGGIGDITENAHVLVRDGKIADISVQTEKAVTDEETGSGTEVVDLHGAPLVPGYVDIHCHGAESVAFDDGQVAVDTILHAHQQHGTAYQCFSLVTDDVDKMAALIEQLAPAVQANKHALGIHPEGPFLSPKHKGAHPEHFLRDPAREAVAKLVDAADGTIAQFTLAPERDGGLNAIEFLREKGIVVSLGHSAADFDMAHQAFDAGASILTHAFNGMTGIHHRAPGPVVAALRNQNVWLEVINDGIHVHPAVVEGLFLEAPERMILITDAMSATCSPDGAYMLGTLEVTVTDGIARLKDGGSLAGSTLTMDKALANAVQRCHVPLDVAVAAATSHPAQAVGAQDYAGAIDVGRDANMVVLDPETLLPTHIYIDGERIV